MKSSRRERPTLVTAGVSSNVITGRVSPDEEEENEEAEEDE